MKHTIAICLPTYNEEDMIQITTNKADEALKAYTKNCITYIVNCDSASRDNTTELFRKTQTSSKKVCIEATEKGKGINILNFINFCIANSVDYALMLDVDVVSMNSTWIDRYLNELMQDKTDFIVPSYRRSRFEGSTTNWFAFPIVFGLTGFAIRQPIAGDFAFNRKYMEYVIKQATNSDIKTYGIDIFLTLHALYGGFRISTLSFEQKIHKPSFPKMYNMFGQVLRATLFTLRNQEVIYRNIPNESLQQLEPNLISGGDFGHKEEACKLKERSYANLQSVGYDVTQLSHGIDNQEWCNIMFEIIEKSMKHHVFSSEEIHNYIDLFIIRAVTYWNDAESLSTEDAEALIIEFARTLRRRIIHYVKG